MKLSILKNRRLILLISCALVAACSIMIPKKTDRIIFSHKVHAEEEIDCDECHDEIANDAETIVQAIPRKPQCTECHEEEVEDNCKMCHTDVKSPATWDTVDSRQIIFSHQLHLKRKAKCGDCHVGIKKVRAVSAAQPIIPQHNECKSCHQQDLESGRCRRCHKRLDLYKRRPESLYSHNKGFFDRHGLEAASSGQDHCAVCHDQSFCADCHARTMTLRPSIRFPEKVTSSFMHRGDWKARHVIESRASDASCMKCHGRSSCNACHERIGVGGRLGPSPHRDQGDRKWAPDSRDSSDYDCNGNFLHGRAARRRISECAACHDQGPVSICVRCHRADGRGCNPHPPGFSPHLDEKNRDAHKMCGICH